MILVQRRFCAEKVQTEDDSEILCIDLKKWLRVVCWYRPPNASDEYLETSLKCLGKLIKCQAPCLILTDANIPAINWTHSIATSRTGKRFLDWLSTNSMRQLVRQPTRGTNCLDLVICRLTESIVSSLTVTAPFLFSDHSSICLSLSLNPSPNSTSLPAHTLRPNFRKCDFDSASAFISSIDWYYIDSICGDVTEFCSILYSILEDCIENFVPLVPTNVKKHALPDALNRLRLCRLALYHNRKLSCLAMSKYKKCDKRYRRCLYRYFAKREESLLSEGPNAFFRYVSEKKGNKCCSIPPLLQHGCLITSSRAKSELLADRFASCFTIEDGLLPPLPPPPPCTLSYILTGPKQVLHALQQMAPKMSAGNDRILPQKPLSEFDVTVVFAILIMFSYM